MVNCNDLFSRSRVAAILSALAWIAAPAYADDAVSASVGVVRVAREPISQQVDAYGVVAAASASVTAVNLPYPARIVQVLVLPGQRVKRGAPLFVVQADPTAVLAATQAASTLTLARGELARTKSLYDDGLATQSQLAAARNALDDAQQALDAQRQLGAQAGERTVTSSLTGVVSQIAAAPGDAVPAGTALAQLVATDAASGGQANVLLGVEPSAATTIHAGDAVELHGLSTALADTGASGRVVVAGAAVDAQTQLVDIGANVPLAGTAFLPGMRVKAEIATHTGTWWVAPRVAVLRDAHGAYVFQVDHDSKAHRVDVTVRVENGDRYGVDGPLDPSEPLVSTGNYELEDGMRVRIVGGATQ